MDEQHDESDNLLNDQQNNSLESSVNVQNVVLKWENINFSIDSKPEPIEILKNISGFANPKEIYAIMGSSGCGKTSLLSLLSNQIMMQSNFIIKGNIWMNSTKLEDINICNMVRYIPQESILHEFFTPYEFLKFTLNLKVSESSTRVKKRVNEVLEQFKLVHVKHSIIGGVILKGLSGGEKKRLSIASEVLLYPSVLILDEPTSGLDSFMAKSIIHILKDITKSGVTVIMTIHQPSYEIYEMIDRLALMQLGEFTYQGKAKDALNYFKDVGFEAPQLVNPPEFFMKLLRIEDRNNISPSESKLITQLQTKYTESNSKIWSEINQQYTSNPKLASIEFKHSMTKSIKWLFWRELINFKRNPLMIGMKLAQTIIFVIILNILYNNLNYDDTGVEERRGVIIIYLFLFVFIPGYTHSFSISVESKIVLKEIKEGLYSISPYYAEKMILEVPILLFTTLTLIFSTYYVLDLNQESNDRVFRLLLIGILAYFQGFAIGLMGGAISANPTVAHVVAAALATGFMLFSGYFNDPTNGPEATAWIRFLMTQYFLRNAALKNEFDDLDLDSSVLVSPDSRYNYDHGGVIENVFISFIHFFCLLTFAVLITKYRIYKSLASKRR